MRRGLVPALLIQCLVILILIEGFGLKLYHTEFEGYYGCVERVSGVVKSVKIKEGYSALNLDVGWENILVRLDDVTDEARVYDLVGREISVTGRISEPDARRNPLCFDYRQYLRARHCYALMDVSRFKLEVSEIVNYPLHILAGLKASFIVSAKEMMDANSFAITTGVLFGDKSYLDDDLYKSFQDGGIAHILAVSGLHVGLVYGLVRKVLKRNDLLTAGLSVLVLLIYAALADFSISVIRAGLMICLSLLAFQIKRRYDMLSAACAVAMVILAVNPYYLYDSGAQLSFLAAYSLAVILPFCEIRFKAFCDRKRSERLYKIGSIFLPGIVLQIGMAPLMAYHFLNFSIFSIFLNPLAIYIASLLLPFGLICFAVFPVKILFAGACRLCQVFCEGLVLISRLSDFLNSGISVPAPPVSLLAVYYVLIFYYFSETRSVILRKKKELLSLALCAFMCAGCCIGPCLLGLSQSVLPWKYNSYDAVFLDVGQGDCIHVQSNGVNVLIDGGGSLYKDVAGDILRPYLLKHGINTIDLAFVTHLDSDHSKGIADLSGMMRVKTMVFPVSVQGEDLSDFICDEIVFVSEGDIINAGEAVFEILSPKSGNKNQGSNENAIVSLCRVGGRDILLMSDAPKEIELLLDIPGADIIKLGHHGSQSSTSTKLLKDSGAGVAVISCGRNNRYGHPHKSVLELLESSGIIIRRTDSEGALLLRHGELKCLK